MTDRFAFDVSFVITVYNKAPYMGPMLRSLERQAGGFTREFIFVDDGSTDGSVDLIREATADWDHVRIISQKNAGPAIATNTGGFAAKGEFIKIVDADDVMTPFATQRLWETIRDTGVDYLYGRWRYADDPEEESLKETDFVGEFNEYADPLGHFMKHGMAGSTNVILRTDVFNQVGGADPELFVQDMSMPLRFAKNHRIGTVDVMAVMGPRDVDGRIMGNNAEVVYSLTATMYHFLRDNPDVAPQLQRIAFKRCAGRSWKWAKRNNGKTFFSREFGLYLLSRLPIWKQTAALIGKTIHVWDAEDIRYMIKLPD
ncbi:MAG: glycosyltransferase family 2 protein [Rhodospirillales bacterium]|nr:glycosyltransferase family 2 protein [Rhodospirillales bacterium]